MSSEESKKNNEQAEQAQSADNAQGQAAGCKPECAAVKDRFLRMSADFQNYKSRIEKERMQSVQLGQLAVIGKLLTIMDDVDRAIEEAKKQQQVDDTWLAGFEMISKALYQLLTDHHIKPIDQMKTFDPELHEALAQIDSPDHQSGEIVDVMQKGYLINDRVLRPAKVTVAK